MYVCWISIEIEYMTLSCYLTLRMCYSCSMSGCATAVIKPNTTLTAVANLDISRKATGEVYREVLNCVSKAL